jgi:O-antigen/teichoic acid export membrane protein
MNISKLIKEGGWVSFGSIFTTLGGLVLLRILTEKMLPSQYGELALALTIMALITQVFMGGINAGIARFYSIALQNKDLHNYFYASQHLLIYVSVVVISVCLLSVVFLYILNYPQWIALAATVTIFSILTGYRSTLGRIQNSARQRATVSIYNILDAWLKIPLSVGALLYFGSSAKSAILGFLISSLAVTIFQARSLSAFFNNQKIQEKKNQKIKKWVVDIWIYSIPYLPWTIIIWMQQSSGRWFLQFYSSTSEVGVFAALFQLGFSPVLLLSGIAITFLQPIFYERTKIINNKMVDNSGVTILIRPILVIGGCVAVLSFILTNFLHEEIFNLFVAEAYSGSSFLMPWLVLAAVLFGMSEVLLLKLQGDMKSVLLSKLKVITGLFGILLNYIGVLFMGMQGLVGGIVIFSVFNLFIFLVYANKQIR